MWALMVAWLKMMVTHGYRALLRLTGLALAGRYTHRVCHEHDIRLEFELLRAAGLCPLMEEPLQTVSHLVRRAYRAYRQWKFRRAVRRFPPLPRSFFESGSSFRS